MGKTVGIDFGTTNSVIAVMEGADAIVIPNDRGGRLTPSAVAFGADGEKIVGAAAKNQAVLNYERVVTSIKRKIGSEYCMEIDGQEYSTVQIASFIIGHLKKYAEDFLDDRIESAVITVPAYFNDAQRNAVRSAGEAAGLRVMRLINEPTAAALAYGLQRGETGTIAVFDLGGGTFDISILDVSKDVYEVVATRGNNNLGGDDFDARIVSFLCDAFFREHKLDLRADRMALQKVREAAEGAKIELSSATTAVVSLPFISADTEGPKHLHIDVTRGQFEGMIEDYLEELNRVVEEALDDAGMEPGEIDAVLLVGGSTRIPVIQKMLEAKFGKLRKSVHPDEAVALGAAIQAGILAGDVKGLVLVDVTALSLGIETENDVFVPIIERNSCIPISRKRTFTTVTDNQNVVEIHVLQGERAQASRNFSIGRFMLSGIPPARRGNPKIDVVFDIDANGLVDVTAREAFSGVFHRVKIDPKETVTDDTVNRILEEAEIHRQEDSSFLNNVKVKRKARLLLEKIKDRMTEEGPSFIDERPGILETLELFEETMNQGEAAQIEIALETLGSFIKEPFGEQAMAF